MVEPGNGAASASGPIETNSRSNRVSSGLFGITAKRPFAINEPSEDRFRHSLSWLSTIRNAASSPSIAERRSFRSSIQSAKRAVRFLSSSQDSFLVCAGGKISRKLPAASSSHAPRKSSASGFKNRSGVTAPLGEITKIGSFANIATTEIRLESELADAQKSDTGPSK
ncbi:hypothetical protein FBQ96_13640 [Nitrospirales bacterium NOB]|nr:MAG: hypothetical protein EDM74_09075 [Armatimonadota bacterium]MBL1151625.1 hypothetical protein [Armatimonadota bacterium]MDL1890596.1 hypothetical protein [Nitrospirales bacterium NOB]GIK32714.1 MAG: hypothetical protein BroJett009_17060 [Armatimonadota bacterium]